MSIEREALIALVRYLGEQSRAGNLEIQLPLALHGQLLAALGDDFYYVVEQPFDLASTRDFACVSFPGSVK